MLTKFETKSECVRGLSFHRKRPWILASLDSGVIQLWDYYTATLIDRFDEHRGPVRGVHFHDSHPLFVSGGDDFRIKVWNYRLRRCLFTLLGHLGYIRTVQFHHDYNWIASASDDRTVRIWDWQSRTCIYVLNGHHDAVTCASFHPKEGLLVSASSDRGVRVWDVGAILQLSQMDTDNFSKVGGPFIGYFESHYLGAKWASFHPTRRVVVYAAACQIKIGSMKGSCKRKVDFLFTCYQLMRKHIEQREIGGLGDVMYQIWLGVESREVDTLRGHMNDVSCALFHAKQDIIVSSSEDKSIRVWDSTKGTCLHTFSREHDQFGILSVHPEINLLAAGHDSGMIVFKLERERPAFSVSRDSVIFVKDRFLRVFDYSTHEDVRLTPILLPGSHSLNQGPRTLSYSPTGNAVLVLSDVDGGSYELYVIRKDIYGGGNTVQEAKRGVGGSAVFVTRNRFAVLEKSGNQVLIKNLKNGIVKKSVLPIATDAIFYAGTGNLLCRSEDRVVKFDLQQRNVVGYLQTPVVRYVVWSPDMASVALLSKHSIVIADTKLVPCCTLHETMHVKSGAWDENGVFVYTTLTHIKYCLPNGDSGIIKTLDAPVYITKIYGNSIFCLDREGENRHFFIDSTEYIFKLSLLGKRFDQAINMIKNSELCGQAIIAYMLQKGFPQIALYFVKDESTRFNLALECGNIENAFESAKKIDEKDHWYRLGIEALRQGNTGIVEYAYQKTKNFDRLSFHYLITGNLDKLSKMTRIGEVKNDVMRQFHVALYLGDIRERVKILENAGHLPLAYITATVHGLHDIADRIAVELGDSILHLPKVKRPSLLIPPSPVLCAGNWPLLMVKRIFKGDLDDTDGGGHKDYEDPDRGEGFDTDEMDMRIMKANLMFDLLGSFFCRKGNINPEISNRGSNLCLKDCTHGGCA